MTGLPERQIEVTAVGKRFGARWVLRGVTLGVRRGEAVGLLGSNGTGKSTVLRVIGTLLRPNSGTVSVNGIDAVRDADLAREQVGYLAHTPGLYDDLTARENLAFAADMLGMPRTIVDAMLDRVGLDDVANERVRGFSAGMQRRVALGRLIMRKASVLLLDEPYANLDANGVSLMNSLIKETIREGGAALIGLHETAPARGVLDRVLTLMDGRVDSAHADKTGPRTALAMSEQT
ncbi:MAG TPA: heme ABC exporter ATP-binding protein CcmA [Gemmatimonadaceae bacterium]|nr:heme ABC exporter ATP-binding protein CcmA [Gemmatimonadaceae bacterium]